MRARTPCSRGRSGYRRRSESRPENLAKVGVAGSNPVVRSREVPGQGRCEPALLLAWGRRNGRGSRYGTPEPSSVPVPDTSGSSKAFASKVRPCASLVPPRVGSGEPSGAISPFSNRWMDSTSCWSSSRSTTSGSSRSRFPRQPRRCSSSRGRSRAIECSVGGLGFRAHGQCRFRRLRRRRRSAFGV